MKMNKLIRAFSGNSLNKLLKTVRIVFILSFLGSLQVFAVETDTTPLDQQIVVTGIITDSNTGEPVIGANIQVKGTTLGAISNIEGKFSISVPSNNATLIFSFIGYVAQEVALEGKSTINISLTSDLSQLDEVVVIGYGTVKKVNQTGAIASVQSKALATYTTPDLSVSLAGRMPGLRVMQIGGEPGKYDSQVDIRGWGTMLVIVDGVPRSDFQRIDPNSISSVSILKDASAAVYGVKAANGVMLITTKQGAVGKARINLNSTYGVQRMSDYPVAITNSIDNLTLLNEAALVAGTPMPYPDYLDYTGEDPNKPSIDYWNLVFRQNAPIKTNSVSIDGGTDKIKYRFFASNLGQEDVWKQLDKENKSGYNRYNWGANVSAELYKGLVAHLIFSGLSDNRSQPYITTDGKAFRQNYMEPSYIPVYANNDPAYYNDGLADFNPLAIIDEDLTGYWREKNQRYETTFSLTYDIPTIKGLQLKGLYAYDAKARTRKMMRKYYNEYKYLSGVYKPTGVNQPSQLGLDSQQENFSLYQLSASYKTTIAGSHNISTLLLGEGRQTTGTYFLAQRFYSLDVLDQLNAGLTENAVANGADWVPSKNVGLVGRVNYDYKSKYLAEFSFRYDGSSLFPEESRWGFFPAVSLGWRLSEEQFIKGNLPFITHLKLRFSHGVMGDDAAARGFEYMPGYIYPSGSYLFSASTLVTGASSKGLANPNITWYTATTTNVGFEFDLFKSLLFGQFDVFRRNRDGLLATRAGALPSEFGANFPQENLESDLSKGFELELGHKNTIGGNWSYSISANLTWARSKWLYREVAPYGSTYSKWRSDQSDRWKNMRWGYGFVGQFQNQEEINTAPSQSTNGHAALFPGDVRYEDWNGDGMISNLDEFPVGRNNEAEVFYGLDLNTAYKGFSLSLLWQGATNYTLLPTAQMSGPLMWGRNSIDIFMDRWHHEDPLDFSTPWVPGRQPISRTNFGFSGNKLVSEFMLQDIWYVRLKNVELSYTLPVSWTRKIYIQELRVFANGTNVLTFKTKRAYFDPEKRLDGGEAQSGYKYPLMKNFNLGIDITF